MYCLPNYLEAANSTPDTFFVCQILRLFAKQAQLSAKHFKSLAYGKSIWQTKKVFGKQSKYLLGWKVFAKQMKVFGKR